MREKIPSEPTISVILPTQNRCWTLGRQISAIWPQINADDQLIILANGCTDYTTQIVSLNSDWLSDYLLVPERLGVCGAYNMAASMARCDRILGANDHNELAPMALDAFRRMAVKHPTTRVMHGRIDAMHRREPGEFAEGRSPQILCRMEACVARAVSISDARLRLAV